MLSSKTSKVVLTMMVLVLIRNQLLFRGQIVDSLFFPFLMVFYPLLYQILQLKLFLLLIQTFQLNLVGE